jgi:hypothetical protein
MLSFSNLTQALRIEECVTKGHFVVHDSSGFLAFHNIRCPQRMPDLMDYDRPFVGSQDTPQFNVKVPGGFQEDAASIA